jgi:hypothetical protein
MALFIGGRRTGDGAGKRNRARERALLACLPQELLLRLLDAGWVEVTFWLSADAAACRKDDSYVLPPRQLGFGRTARWWFFCLSTQLMGPTGQYSNSWRF